MTSVITGDIINSSAYPPEKWLRALKEVLNQYGKEPKDWEIYRGDSFQLEVAPLEALKAAIHIKASIKQLSLKIDARLSIGIGDKTYRAKKITEANGSAFTNSGKCFEKMKKTSMVLCSPWSEINASINLNLRLALLTMDHWTPNSAEMVKKSIEHPDKTQEQLAKMLKISQSNISSRLNRGGYEEIMAMEQQYQTLIHSKC